jgi:hypothetical protein
MNNMKTAVGTGMTYDLQNIKKVYETDKKYSGDI